MTALLAALAAVAVVVGARAMAQPGVEIGRVGASLGVLGNGRLLHPAGAMVALGNFPTGGALTPDGRFYWTVSTGRGHNDIRIVATKPGGGVIQVLPLPGASGGIVMDPVRRLAYVSGVADSDPGHADQQLLSAPGRGGDVLHVFSYTVAGTATFVGLIPVPPSPDAKPPQSFPPGLMAKKMAWPDRLAVSRDGSRLLVALNLSDAAAVVDAQSRRVIHYVDTGSYPYGAAILADGHTGLVSNESPGTVSAIDMNAGRKLEDIQVGGHLSHPEAIAVDPKAARAYVAIANSDEVAVIDTAHMVVQRTLSVGRIEGLGTAPVALTVTPDGRELLVAEEGADAIAVFGLPGSGIAGPQLSTAARAVLDHEATVAAAQRIAGASANDPGARGRRATLSRTAHASDVVEARSTSVPDEFPLLGSIPTAAYPMDVGVTAPGAVPCAAPAVRKRRPARHRRHPRRYRKRALNPDAHDASARRARHARPSARRAHAKRRPAAVAMCSKLVWIAAKGIGTGPNPHGPNPFQTTDANTNSFQYLPLITFGRAGILNMPSPAQIAAMTPVADAQIRPSNPQAPPADTPLRPGGPIKHVFYFVKENRTYDQVMGDDPRGDGDSSLTLFGRNITPNQHALAQRFPLLDHVYANSEASIDGHFWASAAKVSDYVNKNWHPNYGGRGRPYDFGVYSVTWPGNGFLFDQAQRQGISYFNYGEAIAGTVPFSLAGIAAGAPVFDKDASSADTQETLTKFNNSDLGFPVGCYPNDASIGTDAVADVLHKGLIETYDSTPPLGASVPSESRFDCFKARFTAQLATGTVPSFNYLTLPSDHTVGLSAGGRSPRAMVAENDYGLGQFVDLISHSSIWNSSAIFVIEDDSQDGSDHVDAHRMPAYVISPYAKPGAVVHTRYDMLSVIRSMELIVGMKPLGLFDYLATPMYDAFQGTPANNAPYSVLAPTFPLNDRNPSGTAGAAFSARFNFQQPDQISQRDFDKLMWWSVHGVGSKPPPPGPNAVPGG